MPTKEYVQPSSYQTIVTQQINRFLKLDCNSPNPLSRGVFIVADQFGEIPLWALPFVEKPAQPEVKNIFQVLIDYEDTLIALQIPRQYIALDIEREIVLDMFNDRTLIERLYGVRKKDHKRELTAIATLVKKGWKHVLGDEWLVTVQSPQKPMRVKEGMFQTKKISTLLKDPLPITLDVRLEDGFDGHAVQYQYFQ
jgi:hypothetical protein